MNALRPKFNDDAIVEKEEIAEVIKCLKVGVESKEIRERMSNLKDYAANALNHWASEWGQWENFTGL